MLLGRDSWMRFNNRSYRSLLPRPSDHRIFGELELSHHAPAGVRAYAVDPVASGGGFHLRYDDGVGFTLSDEPQLLSVNLIRSQALTGHYLVSGGTLCRLRATGPSPRWGGESRTWQHPRSRRRPSHVRSAGRHAARQSTSRPFLWPARGDPDLCRYGFTSRSCGRYSLALALPARAFDPSTARFVPSRLGTTAVTSARGFILPSRPGLDPIGN